MWPSTDCDPFLPYPVESKRRARAHRSAGPIGYASGVTGPQDQTGGAVKERSQEKTKEPQLYKVVLLNDDYSTMDFVILVLESVFQKSPAEAYRIMMQVHVNGRGIAGIYPWEIAETKVDVVATMAREAGYPLRATTEEA
jgi:ATP-dependent Clp protease adaptor protein ClpS